MQNLTQSQEDYLEEIYIEITKSGSAKVTEISNALNVKKASVSEALNNLCAKGLIKYAPYAPIELTNLGRELARGILRKHELMANFFTEVLRLDEGEAQECACKIEHILSEDVISRFAKFSAFFEEYSKGDEKFQSRIKGLYEDV